MARRSEGAGKNSKNHRPGAGAGKIALGVFLGLIAFSVLAIYAYAAWHEYSRNAEIEALKSFPEAMKRAKEQRAREEAEKPR